MKNFYGAFRLTTNPLLLTVSAIAFITFVSLAIGIIMFINRIAQSNVVYLIIGIIVIEFLFWIPWIAIVHLMRSYVDNELKIRTYEINKFETDIITECHLIETELTPLSFKEWSQINPTKTISDYYHESKYIY